MEKICGYCTTKYTDETNHSQACRYHPQFYFPYDIDKDGIHSKGWQCCHSTDPKELGCVFSTHHNDVRKVYRSNSIAYDYVIINQEE